VATQKKTRVFVSFDFDNDKVLKDFIIGQSKSEDSPFEDWSLKEEAEEADWEAEAESRIKHSDKVLVMVGSETYKASGVLKEVAITKRLKKPIFQVIGYKDASPKSVPNAGSLYKWSWDNLKKLLS
jgi:hypothetical protein